MEAQNISPKAKRFLCRPYIQYCTCSNFHRSLGQLSFRDRIRKCSSFSLDPFPPLSCSGLDGIKLARKRKKKRRSSPFCHRRHKKSFYRLCSAPRSPSREPRAGGRLTMQDRVLRPTGVASSLQPPGSEGRKSPIKNVNCDLVSTGHGGKPCSIFFFHISLNYSGKSQSSIPRERKAGFGTRRRKGKLGPDPLSAQTKGKNFLLLLLPSFLPPGPP